jgi:hypothetical protein
MTAAQAAGRERERERERERGDAVGDLRVATARTADGGRRCGAIFRLVTIAFGAFLIIKGYVQKPQPGSLQ